MMKLLCVFVSFLFLFLASYADDTWESYKAKHGKLYRNHEELTRRKQYEMTHSRIIAHNERFHKGLETYKMKHNHLSDKSPEEKVRYLGLRRIKKYIKSKMATLPSTRLRALPPSYDLRSSSCMPKIRDQKDCGCCWALAATLPIEYQYCVKTNRSRDLSVQQVIDCTYAKWQDGCNGGDHHDAWYYLYKSGGQEPASVYPYTSGSTGKDGTCKFSSSKVIVKLANAGNDLPQNETAIQAALVIYGPITIAYYVSDNFYFYTSGVFSDSSCLTDYDSLNHEMVIVGYGVNGTTPYWIIRNTWGTGWGLAGYALVLRGKNTCGIAVEAGYPTIA